MPAGKGVKLMDMIAVSWQFWLWMWSSCIEQDSVSNNNSSNNRAELWNYVIVLKEEEILWSTKKMRSWVLLNAWHLNERGCGGHKGNSIQLSAWRTIWANYSLCFVKKSVFPYLARERVHVWRRLSEAFSQALQSAGKSQEMCKAWVRAGVNQPLRNTRSSVAWTSSQQLTSLHLSSE